jgi:hypothetical protein
VPRLNRAESLNRLLALHYRSLPMYLRDARPWTRRQDERAEEVLAHLIADHQRIVDLSFEALLDEGGDIEHGAFPMTFTDLHDLSFDYLLGALVENQTQLAEQLQALVDDSGGEPLALEALGLAKGHLEELRELTTATVVY